MIMHHIPIYIALKALADTASKVWDITNRKANESVIRKDIADQQQAHDELATRFDAVEKAQNEQGALMKELSKSLKEFGEAMEAELEGQRRERARLKAVIYVTLGIGVVGLAVALFVLIK
jgi:hypothetical protein